MTFFKTWSKAVATAIIFLTRLPMPWVTTITAEDQGRSLLCFPLVGAIIGLILWVLAAGLTPVLAPAVIAAVIVACWAAITGGLHLDGLADSADGWLGGINDVERTLEIMQDSRCGSGALVAVVCLLMVKFAAVTVIVEQQLWSVLIIAPVIGRCVGPLLFIPQSLLSAPYVQPTGIAKNFIDHCPPVAIHTSIAAFILCCIAIGDITQAIIVTAGCLVTFFMLRRLMLERLGGSTGDTAGATTEIIETIVLLLCGTSMV